VNDSTFGLLRDTIRKLNRHRLLRLRSKLYCMTCKELKRVTDHFPSGESLLECQHRRQAFLLDKSVSESFEAEAKTRRRLVAGRCLPNAGGTVQTFVEDVS
jgi:hypothetical protein